MPFVNLNSFPNGWKWNGKLKQHIKIKHYNNLKNLDDAQIDQISNFLNGQIMNSKIFSFFNWVIYFNPIPSLEIYFICERNIKKGDNFAMFFSKESGVHPIEELYGFAMIYLTCLSIIGYNKDFHTNILQNDDFIEIENITSDKKYKNLILNKCYKNQMNIREILKNIEHFNIIQDYTVKKDQITIDIHPIKNIKFRYIESESSKKLMVTKDTLNFYSKKLLISLAVLIFNALNREYLKNKN